jgi:hypothetical protein
MALEPADLADQKQWLNTKCEYYNYGVNWEAANDRVLARDNCSSDGGKLDSSCELSGNASGNRLYADQIDMRADSGAYGLSWISKRAASLGQKVYISAAGGDEVMSDYAAPNDRNVFYRGERVEVRFPNESWILSPVSTFGGSFPENLSSIFPWPGFFGENQRNYLRKEELVAGSHGIEVRSICAFPSQKRLTNQIIHRRGTRFLTLT